MRPWLFLILMGTFYFEARAQAQSNPWLDTLAAIQSQTQEINCFLDDYRNEFGFDLNESAGRAQSELLALGEHPDPTQARNVLKRFFQSTRDIHTVPIFKTDSPYNATYLPFMIRSAGTGKYYITQISRKALPESAYPFQVSDQLISLGGKPIQEVVSELLPYVSAIDNRTYQQTQAEFSTTVNYDSFGQELKTGSVEIEVKRRFTGAVEKYSVNWITDAKATTAPASVVPAPLATPGPTPSSNLKNYSSTGNRDPFFSDLGNVIWHSAEADPFYAYI